MKINFLKITMLLGAVIFSMSCKTIKKKSKMDNRVSFWVAGYQVIQNDSSQKLSYLINKNEDPNTNTWEVLQAPLEGYYFQAGIMKHIRVKQAKLDIYDDPNNTSLFKYEGDTIYAKKADLRYNTQGEWKLKQINGKAPSENIKNLPILNIDLAKQMVYGNDGCNNFNGPITEFTQSALKLGNLASTLRQCIMPDIAHEFYQAMSVVSSYSVSNGVLHLLNDHSEIIATFEKSESQLINGRWVVSRITNVKELKGKLPSFVLDLNAKTISGNNTCDRFNAKITTLDSNQIRIENFVTTGVVCKDQVSSAFMKSLDQARKFKVRNNTLILFTQDGRLLMQLQREN